MSAITVELEQELIDLFHPIHGRLGIPYLDLDERELREEISLARGEK